METRHLGRTSTLPASPDDAVLDYVPNPRPGALYLVRFAAPEFTSLCPVTGQPDFAHLVIDYAPMETIVESKSLKLFLGSFRNHCGFHEDVTVGIGQRLVAEMKPKWLRIGGYWYPRGGMPIDVFWQSAQPPEDLWIPDQGVQPYRGRGLAVSRGARIAVLGAGSVGCFVGGVCQAAGLPVTFIGRPRLSHDLDQHGLTLSDYAGWRAHIGPGDVDFRCGPEVLDEADTILVTVKSGDTAAAASEIAEHGREGATVISFQNGISNVDTLEQGLAGRFEVARGIVAFNVAYLGGGRFHKASAGDLWSDRRDATEALAARIAGGPAAIRLSPDMLGLAWGKLLINLNNAVNALSGRTLLEELHMRDYRRVFAASIREGLGLLKRAEIEPAKVGPLSAQLLPRLLDTPDLIFNNLFARVWKIDLKARSSMSDDLAAGRKTEVDYLNGELVRLAERLAMDAPVSRAVVDLVHKAEVGAPQLSPKALRLTVLGG
jgi:2-dehydropantoate 2-reductase